MATTLDNFVRSVLAQDATAADTQLVLAKAAPPLRDPPAASAGAPGVIVLQDAPTAPAKIEVIRYTGRTIAGNNVTLTGVTRAQEGTTAQAWTAGTPTFQGITAGVLAEKLDATGMAVAAARLATPRTFSLAGVVSAPAVPFDGTGDVALNTTIPNNALTFAMVNGLQAALDSKLSTAGGTMTGPLTANAAATFNSTTVFNTSGAEVDVFFRYGNSPARQVYLSHSAGRFGINFTDASGNFAGAGFWMNSNTGAVTLMQSTFNQDDNTFQTTAPFRFTGMGAAGTMYWHGTNGPGDDLCAISRGNANNVYNMTWNGQITTQGLMQTNTTSTSALYVANGGNIRIGSSSGVSRYIRTNPSNGNLEFVNNAYSSVGAWLQDNGIWVGVDFQAYSDANLKTNVQRLHRGLYALKQMPPRQYVKEGRPEIGYLAQEAQKVIPEAVTQGDDGYLRLSYGQVTALIGSAVLELDHRLALLEARA
jgi:hypothetical protein